MANTPKKSTNTPANTFEKKAAEYAFARPDYPDALYALLVDKCDHAVVDTLLAVDVGTGNGQAAVKLSEHFNRVAAIDPSPSQLSHAPKRDNIIYAQAGAERIPVKSGTADIVTAAEAAHWFRLKDFYDEADRILKPGGVVALWCYYLPKITPKLDALVDDLFHNELAEYMTPGRRLIRDGYKTIPFPYLEVERYDLKTGKDWSFDQFISNLYSSSVVTRHIEKTGRDPVAARMQDFKKAWGFAGTRRAVWDVNLVMGRKPMRRTRFDPVRRAEIRRQRKKRVRF